MTASASRAADATIDDIRVTAYRIPTETPESDGTAEWSATTLVLVEARGGGRCGIGYTYADTATAVLARDVLVPLVRGADATATATSWSQMISAIRNLGRSGIASMAISAVDNALWDLKARLLDVPLCGLLGAGRTRVPVYGSGGFTSYPVRRLQAQLEGWVAAGIPRVKMKIGRDPSADLSRVRAAREAIGPDAELFVDANGAYSRTEAAWFAERFVEYDVTWYEEPVYHHDFEGLAEVRDAAPPAMDVTSGEYGYEPAYFAAMLHARTVDVLQADATRCEGITGLLVVDGLCEAKLIPLSTHCAPAQHAHPAAALKRLRHIEYFYDHQRIERLLFDGVCEPQNGALVLDRTRPGNGLEFKHADAERYLV